MGREWTCWQGSSGDADIENRLRHTVWEGKGRINLERSVETYTLPYLKQIASENLLCDAESSAWCSVVTSGVGWGVGGRFKKQGTYVYLWLIHADVWQRPTQYYKAIALQLKINNNNRKMGPGRGQRVHGQEGRVRGQGRNRMSPWPVQASLQPCSPASTPLTLHPCLLSLLRKERQARRDQKEGRKQKMY